MIDIQSLSFTYPGASTPSLRDVSLHVERGEFVAVVGNNGCGKSTLCKTLNGIIPHFFTGTYSGSVRVGDLNVMEHTVGELSHKTGYVYQDFENQIVRPTVLDDASFACLNYAMEDYERLGREALRLTGLEGREADYIWQLSGGQTHLLALAGMVALSPEVLVLDEPIAQLDPTHAQRIYDVLRHLNEEHGKTIVVIEHHTEFIAQYCHSIVMMHDGKLLWKLPAREGLGRVEQLLASNIYPPQVTLAAQAMPNRFRGQPLPITTEEGVHYFEGLEAGSSFHLHTAHSGGEAASVPGETVARLDKVALRYRAVKGEAREVLGRVTLDIRQGEKIALIGNNGAGKSSILKLLMGFLKPAEGAVTIYGTNTRDTTPERLSHLVSLVHQNPEEMFISDTVRGDIEYALKARGRANWGTRTEALLDRFNLREIEQRDARLLSGGQMRRASLAVGIALEPSILLLDEPTANLDIATKNEIIRTLEVMKSQVETVVIATHDMQLVCEWADRIIVLSEGSVVADGSREDIFSRPRLLEAAGIRPPQIFELAARLDPLARCYTVADFVRAFGPASAEREEAVYETV